VHVCFTCVPGAPSRPACPSATLFRSWTASGIPIQLGPNVLTVTAQDAAGNTGTATLTVTAVDAMAPTVAITSPTSASTYTTSSTVLTLGGTAADNVGVTQVTWATGRGASGTATGTTRCASSGIPLPLGPTVPTATAHHAAGNTGTATLTVTAVDAMAPTVTITSPTSASTYTTTSNVLTLGGTAADNVAITQVTWANSQGGSGPATGTTNWTTTGIPLRRGTNVLTVTAQDAAGNTVTATLTVHRSRR